MRDRQTRIGNQTYCPSAHILQFALIDIQLKCISNVGVISMQVAKWGNSLAVRLPASLVDALELQEGDDIEIVVEDRKSVVEGKSVSVRVDLGGRRILKKKKT